MTVREQERLGDLDLMRLLAILLVVAHNVIESSIVPLTGSRLFFASELIGALGVGVFFFISGYLLQRGYPSIETSSDACLFFNRRAWRIFPLYWVALLISLFVGQMATEVGSGISAGNLLVHLLGLQMVLVPTYIPGRAFWFIGAIVVCYLWYPVLIYRGPSVGRLLLRALIVLLLMQIAAKVIGIFGWGTLEYFPIFVLGVAAGTSDFLRSDDYRSWRVIFAVAAVPAIGYAYLASADMGLVDILDLSLPVVPTVEGIVAPLLAILCFILLVREAYVLFGPQSPRVLLLIAAGATASYAVYLFHRSLLAVVSSMVGGPPAAVFAVSVAGILVLFVACYYLQKATDRVIAPVRRRRPGGSTADEPAPDGTGLPGIRTRGRK